MSFSFVKVVFIFVFVLIFGGLYFWACLPFWACLHFQESSSFWGHLHFLGHLNFEVVFLSNVLFMTYRDFLLVTWQVLTFIGLVGRTCPNYTTNSMNRGICGLHWSKHQPQLVDVWWQLCPGRLLKGCMFECIASHPWHFTCSSNFVKIIVASIGYFILGNYILLAGTSVGVAVSHCFYNQLAAML